MQPKYSIYLISKITRAVRNADSKFDRIGGTSRHWTIECFLPELENENLVILTKNQFSELWNYVRKPHNAREYISLIFHTFLKSILFRLDF
jgi:hypothetical protein